uniref:Outer membrane protein beta-barrel domain-containing protein n=1 Tax=candidate division WOR-3 bacterium TaxID=2052148 RepID=A0A7C4YHA1_UNCW3
MKKFMLFLLFAFASFGMTSGGGGGYFIGFDGIDFGNLNNFLSGQGFGKLEKYIFSEGGGGYAKIGNIMIGGSGFGFSDDISSNNYLCKVSFSYGGFEAGYSFLSIRDFNLFALFGVGSGNLTLRIDERFSPPVFDSVFLSPGRTSIIYSTYTVLKGEIGLDYLLAFGKSGKSGGGLLFGIRAGYIYSPTKPDWKFEEINTDVIGGPEVMIKGPYIHFLVIGGAGFGGD